MFSRVLIVVGVILLVVAVFLGGTAIAAVVRMFSIVPTKAVRVVDAPDTVTLEPGEYELWVEIDAVADRGEFARQWQEVEIEVFDDQNSSQPIVDSNEDDNLGAYCPYGRVTIPAEGKYRFETDTRRKVFVTKPLDAMALTMDFAYRLLLGILSAVSGAVLVTVGIMMAALRRKKPGEPSPRQSGSSTTA